MFHAHAECTGFLFVTLARVVFVNSRSSCQHIPVIFVVFDQRKVQAQAESRKVLLKEEDLLHRQRELDMLRLQEESAARLEQTRLASEKSLLEDRLSHERALLREQLQVETEGKLRLEVCMLDCIDYACFIFFCLPPCHLSISISISISICLPFSHSEHSLTPLQPL
jgi:hypothetical protein